MPNLTISQALAQADLLVDRPTIDKAIAGIADAIARDYKGEVPLFLSIMHGALPFAGQLAGATGRRASCSIVANLRQKQPTIDGKHHAITIGVNGIAHDASAAFTGTFAACFLLGRHIFAISGSAQ